MNKNISNDNRDFNFKNINDDIDFEFYFSGQLDRTSLCIDELFNGGKFHPLKPPPSYDSSTFTVAHRKVYSNFFLFFVDAAFFWFWVPLMANLFALVSIMLTYINDKFALRNE